jgi:hypothetical protein
MPLIPERRILGRAGLLVFLDNLEQATGSSSLTVYLPPGAAAADIEYLLKDFPAESIKLAANSPTGAVLFITDEKFYLVRPPFPVTERLKVNSLDSTELRSILSRDYSIGIVLVRLGSYAVGICEGEKMVTSKVGTGLVHGRHRQGGSSAHRFERHRDKQIEYFLTRVCQHAREHLEPYVKSLNYLAYGGARTTILLLQKRCPFLARIDAPTLPPLLDIHEPRQAVLEDAVKRIWSGTVIEWKEE